MARPNEDGCDDSVKKKTTGVGDVIVGSVTQTVEAEVGDDQLRRV